MMSGGASVYHWVVFSVVILLKQKISYQCVVTESNVRFPDLALRSRVVLRAKALDLDLTRKSGDDYDVIFRVFGVFSSRSGNFSIGDYLTLGPFGKKKNCVQIKMKLNYILFLRGVRQVGGERKYVMRYNPILYSALNAGLFRRVLSGSYRGGRSILRSGCPQLVKPTNGRYKCGKEKRRCKIVCKRGYKVVGKKMKICNVRTMRWAPKKRLACKKKVVTTPSSNNRLSLFSNIRKSMDFLRPVSSRRRYSNNNQEEEEEEEEEDSYFNRRSRRPPLHLKKYPKPSVSKKNIKEKKGNFSTFTNVVNSTVPLSATNRPTSEVVTTNDFSSSSTRQYSPTPTVSTTPSLTKTITTPLPANKNPSNEERIGNTRNEIVSESNSANQTITQQQFNAIKNYIRQAGDIRVNIDGSTNVPLLGHGSQIVGCPTYVGNTTIHSSWRGGFDGTTQFPYVVKPLIGGWMVRILFNIPVEALNTYTVDTLSVSKSLREYVFVPKHYNKDLYQDLTVGFLGKSTFLTGGSGMVEAKSFLLGLCNDRDLENMTIGQLQPFDDLNGNISEAWITNTTGFSFSQAYSGNSNPHQVQQSGNTSTTIPWFTTLTPNTLTAPSAISESSKRCSLATPNGLLPEGGRTTPQWRRDDTNSSFDFNELLHKSILFYEAQRSGKQPPDTRIPWRGDSDLKDGCPINEDLAGGWYNSGGNVKTTIFTAFSTTLLTWGAINYRRAYQDAGEVGNLLNQIRWGADYLIKSHLSPNELVVQIGDYIPPSEDWTPPEDSYPESRKIYVADPNNPAADVAADVAAALASVSIFFDSTDPTYAAKCLQHAEELYSFAVNFPAEFQSSIRHSQWPSGDNGLADDLAWAAIWLFMATDNSTYLRQAENFYLNMDQSSNLFYWGDKSKGVGVLLRKLSRASSLYRFTSDSYIRWVLSRSNIATSGLLWLNSIGVTMHAANTAFLLLESIDVAPTPAVANNYYNFALEQLQAIVGGTTQGFVVGVGANPPKNPHHRASSCPSPPSICPRSVLTSKKNNPHVLHGAVVNGPNRNGDHVDQVGNWIYNSVAITYNAGFQSLVAGLKQMATRDWLQ